MDADDLLVLGVALLLVMVFVASLVIAGSEYVPTFGGAR